MPDWAGYVRQRLSLPGCRPEREAEIIEELADQLAEAHAEATLSGLGPEAAFALAARQIDWHALSSDLNSSLGLAKTPRLPESPGQEKKNGASSRSITDPFQMDLRLAFRMLANHPAFTMIAVFTLALGIGANTAIFTIANALLLRSLPFADPSQLVLISAPPAEDRSETGWLSLPFLNVLRDRAKSFSGISAVASETFSLSGRGDPEQLYGARTSGNFFDVLGVKPILGRSFTRDEDQNTGSPAVMISYQLWQRLFAGDRAAVGTSLTLESRNYKIIGVLPPEFQFSLVGTNADIWAPRVSEMGLTTPERVAMGGRYFQVIGRLAPGVSKERARRESQAVFQQYRREHATNFDATIDLVMQIDNLHDRMVADEKPAIFILSAAVGFVLLIACANVASLLLARAWGRRKEFAIRTALGGSRAALIRQLLTESVLIALVSGVFGIAIGAAGTRLLATFGQGTLPGTTHVTMDTRVLLFTLLISVAVGVFFGLVPSLQLSRLDLNATLRDEGCGTAGSPRRHRGRSALVIAQVALSTSLLIGTGLQIRSFLRLRSVNPGFDSSHLLTVQVPLRKSTVAQSVTFYDAVLEQTNALPGVTASAISTALPPTATHQSPVLAEGYPQIPMGKRPVVNIQQTSPDYAKVLGIPLIAGRAFTGRDDPSAPQVAMVNETLARQFWANRNPIGQYLWIGKFRRVEIIGVLGDFRNTSLAKAPAPEVYLPFPQLPWSFLCVSLRTNIEPHRLISPLLHAIAAVDPDQPVVEIRTGDELLDASQEQTRFMMFLLGVFSATAFVLAVTGIYGMIAYNVTRRTQELGIRIALGAARRDILRLILEDGLALTGLGILLGLATSLALTKSMRPMLYETSLSDPLALIGSTAFFVLFALIATYVPARRAARTETAMLRRGSMT